MRKKPIAADFEGSLRQDGKQSGVAPKASAEETRGTRQGDWQMVSVTP
ncbi:MAG: hypothetical protein ACLRS8_14590 [Parabacteroides merdae]